MQRVYSLTDEQCTRIDEWSNSHDCRYRCGVKHHTKSPIGGEISITFTPTDVGTIVSALKSKNTWYPTLPSIFIFINMI